MGAGFVEPEFGCDELLPSEAFLHEALLFVFFCQIQDVVQLMRKHAAERAAVKFVGALALAGLHRGLHGALYTIAEDGTERLYFAIDGGAEGQSATGLGSAFVNQEWMDIPEAAIALEVDDHKVRKGVTGLKRFEWFPIEFDGLAAPDFSEFGLQGVDNLGLGVALVEGNDEGDGFLGLPVGRSLIGGESADRG